MDINNLKIDNDEQAEKINSILKNYYKMDINNLKIDNDEQMKEFLKL